MKNPLKLIFLILLDFALANFEIPMILLFIFLHLLLAKRLFHFGTQLLILRVVLAHSYPDVPGIVEMHVALVILVEFYLHPYDVYIVGFLNIVPNFVTNLHAEHSRRTFLQFMIIFFLKLGVIVIDVAFEFFGEMLVAFVLALAVFFGKVVRLQLSRGL